MCTYKSLGWPVEIRFRKRTTWTTIIFAVCMFNFGQYFNILSTSAANELKKWPEEEDLSASVIFLGSFLGNGHVFVSIASNYKAEHSNSCTFKCVIWKNRLLLLTAHIKSLKGNSKQKLSFHKEMYGNSAILYQLVKGFSHYFVVFTLFVSLAWCQKLVWHWINILYWLLYNIILFLFGVDMQWKTW